MTVGAAALEPSGWPVACEDVLRNMYEAVSRFTVPIALSLSDRHGKHLGTGNFLDVGDIKSLISCEHVFGKRKTNALAHRVIGSERYFVIDGPGASAPEPLDVAVAAIAPVLWNERWRKSEAVPEDRLAIMHRAVPNELFFVFGFAEENSRFLCDTLEVAGTAYLCREKPLPQLARLDRQIHFSLEYNRDLAVKLFGPSGLPDPHGMSGSLVWNTRFIECTLENRMWTPSEADVAGTVWSWPQDETIVATRVEYVRSFLLSVVTSWGRDLARTAGSDASSSSC